MRPRLHSVHLMGNHGRRRKGANRKEGGIQVKTKRKDLKKMAIKMNLQFCLGWSLMRASVTFRPSPLVTSIVTASLNWFSARLGSQPSQGTSEPAKLTLSQSRILSPQNVLVRKKRPQFQLLIPFYRCIFKVSTCDHNFARRNWMHSAQCSTF